MKRITVRTKQKWYGLREQMRAEQGEPKDPMVWICLLKDIIDNQSRLAKKFKWPMIHAVTKGFQGIPAGNFPQEGYLSRVCHECDVRRHQGYGEKSKFNWGAYSRMRGLAESKMFEQSTVDKSVRSKVPVTS